MGERYSEEDDVGLKRVLKGRGNDGWPIASACGASAFAGRLLATITLIASRTNVRASAWTTVPKPMIA